jgi:hypothetical protein
MPSLQHLAAESFSPLQDEDPKVEYLQLLPFFLPPRQAPDDDARLLGLDCDVGGHLARDHVPEEGFGVGEGEEAGEEVLERGKVLFRHLLKGQLDEGGHLGGLMQVPLLLLGNKVYAWTGIHQRC